MPINRQVLAWALREGGYHDVRVFAKEFATQETPITAREIEGWLKGNALPSKRELVRAATVLKRPTAIFFLSQPPRSNDSANLREARGAAGRPLFPNERIEVRWALRLQREASDLLRSEAKVNLPELRGSAVDAARTIRDVLATPATEQANWDGASSAFAEWKRTLEALGVFVLQLDLGLDGIRGFSSWDDQAPLIAVNNSADQNHESRIFSLFHELGHIARRDTAACGGFSPDNRSIEKWCDAFAAAALLPEGELRAFVATVEANDDLGLVRKVATNFNVSLTATAIRLSDLGLADEYVVTAVNRIVGARRKQKRKGGGGGGPTRIETRRRQLGSPLLRVFLGEGKLGRMSDLDLADFLRVSRSDLGSLAASLEGPAA